MTYVLVAIVYGICCLLILGGLIQVERMVEKRYATIESVIEEPLND